MNLRTAKLIGWSLAGCMLLAGCERPPIDTKQAGYRGTGMVEVTNPRTAEALLARNTAPEAEAPAAAGSPAASTVYQNVPELGHLGVAEFTRLMVAMTKWVSPEQGCNYCHEGSNFASDAVYTKVVARRMLQMTRDINSQWSNHVGATGVTCYTCHRGNPVPPEVWSSAQAPKQAGGLAAHRGLQNAPSTVVGLTSLPYDPFKAYLHKDGAGAIRVVSTAALPGDGGATIQATEGTYGLMMHLSKGLGVNCTHCHNSRSFAEWDQSSPQRVVAWHGLRMVGTLNTDYIEPLKDKFPATRLGPGGDVLKANCATCHQGVAKPLNGAAMVKDYPELLSKAPPPAPAATPAPAAETAGAPAPAPAAAEAPAK